MIFHDTLDILLPLLREKCSGMLEQMAIDHLKKSYRKFCIKSGYVQRKQTFNLVKSETLTLMADTGYYVHEIHAVDNTKGSELEECIDYHVMNGHEISFASYIREAVVTYSIVPILPMSDDLVIANEVINRWPEAIAAGAAATLRMMPEQQWTSGALSEFYEHEFIKGYRKAFRARITSMD
ncbi:MAG: hypothetical protein HRU25_14845, partial [Psychrobium sp.]|nr:hypothetical protein [Psychrobium sp.]